MNLAIVGSRELRLNIAKYIEQHLAVEDISMIISGGAAGIDTLAEKYADSHGIPKMIFYPDYDSYGRSAPVRRNIEIVDASDVIMAFWDQKSKGTKFVIDYAKRKGKKLIEFRVN